MIGWPNRRWRDTPRPACPCKCGKPHGFCDTHKATLAQIRDHIDHEAHATTREGRRQHAQKVICVEPGCWKLRQPPTNYCAHHLETSE